jgi:hypothetical protein
LSNVPALPLALDPLIVEAKRRSRRRRSLVLTFLVVVGGVITLVFMLRSPGVPVPRAAQAAGIRVRLPRGWYVTRRLIDDVSWPVQRFVVSSFPVTFDASAGQYLPPQTGVLAQIVEEYPPLSGEHWQPRPARLRLGRLGKMKLFRGERWTELLFRLHGRHIYVFAWVGRDAPASERRQLLALLEGMRASAR